MQTKTYVIVWYRAPKGIEIGPVVETERITGSQKRIKEYAKTVAEQQGWFFKWIEPVEPIESVTPSK